MSESAKVTAETRHGCDDEHPDRWEGAPVTMSLTTVDAATNTLGCHVQPVYLHTISASTMRDAVTAAPEPTRKSADNDEDWRNSRVRNV